MDRAQNPYDLTQLSIFDNMLAPGERSTEGTLYLLGTDDQGRDMLSAMFYGLKLSFFVGIVSTAVALAIGITAGIIAAYFGGRIDTMIMRIVDLQLSFPAILIALILLALLGKGVDKVIIALVTVQWAYYARTIRGGALVERQREYIDAARNLALPAHRIIFRHLLPNCLPPLVVVATIQVAHAISLEATLSFLGVGVPITEPSLGLLICQRLQVHPLRKILDERLSGTAAAADHPCDQSGRRSAARSAQSAPQILSTNDDGSARSP